MNEDTPPALSLQQITFDELLEKYSEGTEPLENWTSSDLVKLSMVVDAELQSRQPYEDPVFFDEHELNYDTDA